MNLNFPQYQKFLTISVALIFFVGLCEAQVGNTIITEWQYGKNGAVSITYDDASRLQFRRALPLMERLK